MKNSTLFSNSFFIFIIRFFPSLANLLVVIWYSRQLPQDTYGNYQHFWIQLYVLAPLTCMGIHVLAVNYRPGFIMKLLNSIKARQYVFFTFWVILLSVVFAVLQCDALHISFIIPFLYLLCYTLVVIFESFLIVFRSYQWLVATNIIFSATFFAIHWYLLGHSFSLQTLFTYLLIITVLRLCVYSGVAIANMQQYSEEEHEEEYKISKIRELWLHLGLYDVTQVLFGSIDKFVISLALTAQLSAIYYNGSQPIPFLPMLLGAAGSAVLIQLARGTKKNEKAEAVQLMNQLGRVLSCLIFPAFFFLFFYGAPLLIGLLGDKYRPAIPIFMVSLLVLPVRAYHFTTILQRMHKGSIINIGSIGDLILACALIYPLYLWKGLPGVALSFVISTYVQAAFYLYYTAKLLDVSVLKLIPYVNWIIKLIVFATLFIGIRYLGNRQFTTGIQLILGGAAMVVMISVSLFAEYRKQTKNGWK